MQHFCMGQAKSKNNEDMQKQKERMTKRRNNK
jgi:hypothetical protein